jgi:hypothetical protein
MKLLVFVHKFNPNCLCVRCERIKEFCEGFKDLEKKFGGDKNRKRIRG